MKVIVDWKKIKTEDDFYDGFLPQVEALDWHGRNLDALNDSLVTGSVNGLEPLFRIVNINSCCASETIAGFQLKVIGIFSEAAIENKGLEVLIK